MIHLNKTSVLKHKLKRKLRYNLMEYIYKLMIFIIALILCKLSGKHPGAYILYSVFIISMWALYNCKSSLIAKYIWGCTSFSSLVTALLLYHIQFDQYTSMIFIIPAIYAFTMPDAFSPILAGSILAVTLYSYEKTVYHSRIAGSAFAIVITSILWAILSQLLKKLTAERNKYKEMSITDSLTGLFTFSHILEVGQHSIDKGIKLIIYVIDLDHFKQINDTYGHLMGNKILIQIAHSIKNALINYRSKVGRLGGDEFVVIVENCPPSKERILDQKIQNVVDSISFCPDFSSNPIKLSGSIGKVYSKTNPYLKIDELLHIADMNMYFDKCQNHGLDFKNNFDETVISKQCRQLLRVLVEKDIYTYVHSEHVAQYAIMIGNALDLSDEAIKDLYIAGWMHDIGKLFIPNDILRKPGKLNTDEYEIIKGHVNDGINIIDNLDLSPTVINAIKYHHERFDGTGYPYHMAGKETPIEGRILQVIDAFSAITMKRAYKECMSTDYAFDELMRCTGTQFDPSLSKIFIKVMNSSLQ